MNKYPSLTKGRLQNKKQSVKTMASFTSVRHHRCNTQAAWTKSSTSKKHKCKFLLFKLKYIRNIIKVIYNNNISPRTEQDISSARLLHKMM